MAEFDPSPSFGKRAGVVGRTNLAGHAATRAVKNQRLLSSLWIALAAGALVLLFFTPRYVLWRGLYIEPAQVTAEVRRAAFTLLQLRNPFVKIDDPGNNVLNWRLLFLSWGITFNFPIRSFWQSPRSVVSSPCFTSQKRPDLICLEREMCFARQH
jgi:hypothetical protein